LASHHGSEIITPVTVANGGTGATTAAGAASALGVGTEDSPTFAGQFIAASGQLIVGHTANIPTGGISSAAQFFAPDPTATLAIGRWSADAGSPKIHFAKSRNASIGSFTVVQDGDNLAEIIAHGDDGTDLATAAAQILFEVDGTPNANDIPGAIVFSTKEEAASFAERMRIDNAGRLLVGSASSSGSMDIAGVGNYLQLSATTGAGSQAAFQRFSASSDGPGIVFGKSRAGSVGTYTIVQDGDTLGSVQAYGADGTDMTVLGASISFMVDGTPGANDIPGAILFNTKEGSGSFTERMRLDNVGQLGIGTTAPDGTLHVHTATAGAVAANANADDLVIENSAAVGLNFLSPNSVSATIAFGDPEDNDIGRIQYAHAADTLDFKVGSFDPAIRIDSGLVMINDTANANMTVGLTINQGANDNQIFSLKSTDVAHGLTTGITGSQETDDFLNIYKAHAVIGGAVLRATAEDSASAVGTLAFQALGNEATTIKTTSAIGLVDFYVAEHNGANVQANITADGNVLTVRALVGGSVLTCFMIDEDGDMYSVVAGQTFDDYEDALLVRALDMAQAPKKIIKSKWDEYVQYGERALIDAGILGAPVADGGMVNVTQLQRLHNGAIWQLHTRLQDTIERLAQTEAKLLRLENG
jgi:hypothetical protein